ncbi:hypothetical protein NYA22BAC_00749 [Parasphingorhabdus sp. NYA22]
MGRLLRFLGISIPISYLIAMSILVERMFPGWARYFYSFDQCNSDKIFLIPVVIFVVAALKLPRQWLPYLLLVQLLIFVPPIFRMIQLLGEDHVHPWLGLGGLYQLVWMMAALIIVCLGHWFWRFFRKNY